MLNILGLLLLLAALLFVLVIFPGKFFIQSVKKEKGFMKVVWIAAMLLGWPITNFIYGVFKAEKKSARVLAGIFLVLSLVASVYLYRHMGEYMDQLTSLSQQISAQAQKI